MFYYVYCLTLGLFFLTLDLTKTKVLLNLGLQISGFGLISHLWIVKDIKKKMIG